jgi:hypothetical protein
VSNHSFWVVDDPFFLESDCFAAMSASMILSVMILFFLEIRPRSRDIFAAGRARQTEGLRQTIEQETITERCRVHAIRNKKDVIPLFPESISTLVQDKYRSAVDIHGTSPPVY